MSWLWNWSFLQCRLENMLFLLYLGKQAISPATRKRTAGPLCCRWECCGWNKAACCRLHDTRHRSGRSLASSTWGPLASVVTGEGWNGQCGHWTGLSVKRYGCVWVSMTLYYELEMCKGTVSPQFVWDDPQKRNSGLWRISINQVFFRLPHVLVG